jgi:CheY-like chemotaxis protein
MGFHVHIIEDDKTMITSLKLMIQGRIENVRVTSSNFRKAKEKVAELRPDAVVMDVFEDQAQTTTQAKATWDYLWDVHFCPVVVHSARDEPGFLKGKRHPFAHYEAKSAESQQRVAAKLESFRSHVDSLRLFSSEVSKRAAESLRHVSHLIWKETSTDAERNELLVRVTRRRVAASFDISPTDAERMRSWEQYIYPPIDPDLLTGDVLREADGKPDDPVAFRVVLSPSCDLVVSQGGTVQEVLVARCVDVKQWLKKVQLDASTKESKLRERLQKEVTREQHEGIKLLPSLPGHIPLMGADLKNLQLIPIGKLLPAGGSAPGFIRIASVDSPFREQLAWAYIQVAGRPAMPVTDVIDFSEKIIDAVKGAKKG